MLIIATRRIICRLLPKSGPNWQSPEAQCCALGCRPGAQEISGGRSAPRPFCAPPRTPKFGTVSSRSRSSLSGLEAAPLQDQRKSLVCSSDETAARNSSSESVTQRGPWQAVWFSHARAPGVGRCSGPALVVRSICIS